jgi:dTDP-4-dehydrorhamnose 3,5-epimerase-like enzyme
VTTVSDAVPQADASPRDPVVHLYALVWNERPLLPFFLEHYRRFVSHFFLYDDGSTDGSAEYLAEQPDVTLRRFDNAGESFVEAARRFYCDAWKQSRGRAAFVVVVNIDELVHHPSPREALRFAKANHITLFTARGWDVVTDRFPVAGPLVATTNRGVHSVAMNKIALFDPDAITEINYGPGRHQAKPIGRIKTAPTPRFELLHYKHIGIDYVIARYRELGARLRNGDHQARLGVQYSKQEEALVAEHARLLDAARPIFADDLVREQWLDRPLKGVEVVRLRGVRNAKGGLQEIWRDDDPFGVRAAQAYVTTTMPDVVKAWYRHRVQVDQITTLGGRGRLVLCDLRERPAPPPAVIPLDAADPTLIVIPAGIWHGFKAEGDAPLTLLHLNNRAFDHLWTDEDRVDADDPGMPYRW